MIGQRNYRARLRLTRELVDQLTGQVLELETRNATLENELRREATTAREQSLLARIDDLTTQLIGRDTAFRELHSKHAGLVLALEESATNESTPLRGVQGRLL